MANRRLDELFTVLKTIRRIVAAAELPAARAMREAQADREFIDDLRDVRMPARELSTVPEHELEADIVEWHKFSGRLIDERQALATALESIWRVLEQVDIEPRSRELGPGGRGTPAA